LTSTSDETAQKIQVTFDLHLPVIPLFSSLPGKRVENALLNSNFDKNFLFISKERKLQLISQLNHLFGQH